MRADPRRRRARRPAPAAALLALAALALLLLVCRPPRQSAGPQAPPLPDGAAFRTAKAALDAKLLAEIQAAGGPGGLTPPGADGVLVPHWRDIAALSAVTGAPLEDCFARMVRLELRPPAGDRDLFFPSADGTLPLSPRPDAAPRLTVACLDPQEAAPGLTAAQRERLAALRAPTMEDAWRDLFGGGAPSAPEVEALRAALPRDLSPTRRAFVEAACSLVGRVDYFWGGKSSAPGWDLRWGAPALVLSPGSSDSGGILPYGLDCSGLVSWAAVNACGSGDAYAAVGDGVRAQKAASRAVAWEEAAPGDLLFFPDLSHVGIAAGRTPRGALQVIHCSHSLGGVVLTQDAAAAGFRLAGTPGMLS